MYKLNNSCRQRPREHKINESRRLVEKKRICADGISYCTSFLSYFILQASLLLLREAQTEISVLTGYLPQLLRQLAALLERLQIAASADELAVDEDSRHRVVLVRVIDLLAQVLSVLHLIHLVYLHVVHQRLQNLLRAHAVRAVHPGEHHHFVLRDELGDGCGGHRGSFAAKNLGKEHNVLSRRKQICGGPETVKK